MAWRTEPWLHKKTHPPIVALFDSEPLASSDALALGVGHSHESVIKLIRKHKASLERFGPVRFEIRKGSPLPQGGFAKATELALLNESQSTLLISMMRNTPIVVECKVRLVEEFYRMRNTLNHRASGLWQEMQALIAQEVESKIKASFGSRLMLDRKREISFFDSEYQRLEAEIQPGLPLSTDPLCHQATSPPARLSLACSTCLAGCKGTSGRSKSGCAFDPQSPGCLLIAMHSLIPVQTKVVGPSLDRRSDSMLGCQLVDALHHVGAATSVQTLETQLKTAPVRAASRIHSWTRRAVAASVYARAIRSGTAREHQSQSFRPNVLNSQVIELAEIARVLVQTVNRHACGVPKIHDHRLVAGLADASGSQVPRDPPW